MTRGLSHMASGGTDGEATSDLAAVASLDEPTRRRIYDHVRAHPVQLSRNDVADALGTILIEMEISKERKEPT